MKAPKLLTWVIAVVLGFGGILIKLDVLNLGDLNRFAFWYEAGAFGLLFLATLFKGL